MTNKFKLCLVLLFTSLLLMSTVSAGFEFNGADDSDTVKIGYIPTDHEAALFVADAKGMYKDKDIKIDLIKYNNGVELMDAMSKGEIDVGYVGVAPALSAISKGENVKIISSVQQEGSGIIVSKDSQIKDVSDLKGKKIASLGDGSIQNVLLSYYLHENGISQSDVTIENMKATDMYSSLKDGKVDAIVTYQPYITMAKNDGYDVLEESSDLLPNHPCCVIVASDDFTQNHADEAKEILEVHKQATNYINDNLKNNPDEIVKLLPSDVVVDESLEADSLKSFPFTSGLSTNFKKDVKTFQEFESSMGIIDGDVPEDKLFWEP
ncbi:MAG: hypothetical protein BZ137_01450 [Methanosphaera sp. rholeuAM130]|nr:MAG: hypothetical protein BZ137_01450 [Methanosphaera sp. rholeuAM130]